MERHAWTAFNGFVNISNPEQDSQIGNMRQTIVSPARDPIKANVHGGIGRYRIMLGNPIHVSESNRRDSSGVLTRVYKIRHKIAQTKQAENILWQRMGLFVAEREAAMMIEMEENGGYKDTKEERTYIHVSSRIALLRNISVFFPDDKLDPSQVVDHKDVLDGIVSSILNYTPNNNRLAMKLAIETYLSTGLDGKVVVYPGGKGPTTWEGKHGWYVYREDLRKDFDMKAALERIAREEDKLLNEREEEK
jgi:hypothetical protein